MRPAFVKFLFRSFQLGYFNKRADKLPDRSVLGAIENLVPGQAPDPPALIYFETVFYFPRFDASGNIFKVFGHPRPVFRVKKFKELKAGHGIDVLEFIARDVRILVVYIYVSPQPQVVDVDAVYRSAEQFAKKFFVGNIHGQLSSEGCSNLNARRKRRFARKPRVKEWGKRNPDLLKSNEIGKRASRPLSPTCRRPGI
jgi:hypothetical protein